MGALLPTARIVKMSAPLRLRRLWLSFESGRKLSPRSRETLRHIAGFWPLGIFALTIIGAVWSAGMKSP